MTATGKTITEKILARVASLKEVAVEENHFVKPDYMIAYDFPGYSDRFFSQMEDDFGISKVKDPDRYVLFIDHLLSRKDAKEEEVHEVTRKWAQRNGVALHEGDGIGHQVAAELGYAMPGAFLIHFDGHISSLGAFGALGMGVRRDLVEGWITGGIYLDVPKSSRFNLTGEFTPGVESRDLIHHIISTIGADGAAFQVMEYTGPGAESMPLGHRQSLCGMAMFAGGVSAIFNPDEISLKYSREVAKRDFEPLYSDADAEYAAKYEFSLDDLSPQVVMPGSARAANTVNVEAVSDQQIQRAFIGSCASGRIEDIRSAAEILKGKRVATGVELNVVPTSRRIFEQAESEGLLQSLRDAGAHVVESSCDFCFGYAKPLAEGEKCISTGVLNISGRMGSPKSEIFMGSAATVAASALSGRISDPRNILEGA